MDVDMGQPGVEVREDEEGNRVHDEFLTFLREWRNEEGGQSHPVYADGLADLAQPEKNTLSVDMEHLDAYSPRLCLMLTKSFYRLYPFLCQAVRAAAEEGGVKLAPAKEIYVSFTGLSAFHRVRELTADKIGLLLRISGQVVRTHPVHPELIRGTFLCQECNATVTNVHQHFKYTLPKKCSTDNCPNRNKFILDIHRSHFVDFQKLRIQETQGELPRGSIPRSLDIILRGECVESAQPGDRVDLTGTLIVVPDVGQLALPGNKAESASHHRGRDDGGDGLRGLKALGARDLTYRLAFLAVGVAHSTSRLGSTDLGSDEAPVDDLWARMDTDMRSQIQKMAADKAICSNLISSLFPSIYGSEDVKKGVLLMLFGGVPKKTKEGTTLRGDINVCIVGDPSTAKSQMLKQVEELSPRAVYTSGKASSAAGLTAAVVKDEESSEFVIEAGALMLADNGVCAIDEFDKMDPKDQVAIHEAMEQQTISITKAGVKATLNARTSVLAAANPIGGRYDRRRPLRSNVNLSPPILSRFDLFFIQLDEANEGTDYAIARRIVDIHRLLNTEVERVYSLDDIRQYILFARCFKPTISETAAAAMVEEYKRLRIREGSGAANSSWKITVRQLESLIRLSEAIARMYLKPMVEPKHVAEAVKLLKQSIVRVEQPDVELNEPTDEELMDAADAVDDENQDPNQTEDAQPQAGKEKEKQLRLTFEEYKNMTSLLVMHIRKEEESKGCGLSESDLVAWYLAEVQGEVESLDELAERRTLCERVIKRLVTTDNVLLELREDEGFAEDEGGEKGDAAAPLLVVHPNFALEDE